MKILFLSNLYPPIYVGGYELECRDIAEGLRSRGHEITVVTSMHGFKSPQVDGHVHRALKFLPDEVSPGMLSHKFTDPASYLEGLRKSYTVGRYNTREFARILDNARPDVVSVWCMNDISMTMLQEISDRGIPRVHRIATPWVADALEYYCSGNIVRRAIRRLMTGIRNPQKCFIDGLFVTPSDFIGKQLVEVGIPDDQVATIFCPATIPKEVAPLYDGKAFRMLYAGRVCEEKGVHIAVRAVGELAMIAPHAKFDLDIIGDGPEDYLSQLKQEAKDLGVEGRLHFSGLVPREKLEQMRSQYHAFVFTSIWPEPGAMILIESMAYGLPIIASPAGGTGEYLIHEENALTFPIGDHKALAAAMKRLMGDRDLQEKLREGGRRTAFERFDFEKILDLHEHYLLSAAGKAATAPAVTGGGNGDC